MRRIEAEDFAGGRLSLVFVGEDGSMDQVILSPEEQDELARILAERAARRQRCPKGCPHPVDEHPAGGLGCDSCGCDWRSS